MFICNSGADLELQVSCVSLCRCVWLVSVPASSTTTLQECGRGRGVVPGTGRERGGESLERCTGACEVESGSHDHHVTPSKYTKMEDLYSVLECIGHLWYSYQVSVVDRWLLHRDAVCRVH